MKKRKMKNHEKRKKKKMMKMGKGEKWNLHFCCFSLFYPMLINLLLSFYFYFCSNYLKRKKKKKGKFVHKNMFISLNSIFWHFSYFY